MDEYQNYQNYQSVQPEDFLSNTTHLKLDFDRNSMKDATLTVKSQPRYTITTPGKTGSRTEIWDAMSQRLLVTINRRELLWDIVTFADHHNGKSVKLSKWMMQRKLADGYTATYIDAGQMGWYFWKPDVERRFVFYSGQDLAYQTPLAYMERTGSNPSLVLERGTESVKDQIIASFLLVEQEMRMTEKEYKNAGGLGAMQASMAGYGV